MDGWNFTFVRRGLLSTVEGRPAEDATHEPRITFGVIVLNGEPSRAISCDRSTRSRTRSSSSRARRLQHNIATADGHSRDGTLDELRRFKAEEDPDGKCHGHRRGRRSPERVLAGRKGRAEPRYAKRATGNYLWQVDIDEFYRAEEMARHRMLRGDPTITAVTVQADHVLGRPRLHAPMAGISAAARPTTTACSGGAPATPMRRTARRPSSTPRDATFARATGCAARTSPAGASTCTTTPCCCPSRSSRSAITTATPSGRSAPGAIAWAQDAFLRLGRPYRVHNVYDFPSWLERYGGRIRPRPCGSSTTSPARIPASCARRRHRTAPGNVVVRARPQAPDPVDDVLTGGRRSGPLAPATFKRLVRRTGRRLARRVGPRARAVRILQVSTIGHRGRRPSHRQGALPRLPGEGPRLRDGRRTSNDLQSRGSTASRPGTSRRRRGLYRRASSVLRPFAKSVPALRPVRRALRSPHPVALPAGVARGTGVLRLPGDAVPPVGDAPPTGAGPPAQPARRVLRPAVPARAERDRAGGDDPA